MSDNATSGPLSGIRVLDLSQVMAGPFSTMVLADFGAEVIKVENPEGGEQTRYAWRSGQEDPSWAFRALNRNKKSVTLDLKSQAGLREFYTLVQSADVVLENFRPGVVERLGIGYESLSECNPGIIYVSISGFGQTGPFSSRPGYDLIAQAMSGVMSVTGTAEGEPVKAGLPFGDLSAGLYSVIGILMALRSRQVDGVGQYLDVSLYESLVSLGIWESIEYWTKGIVPKALGSAHRVAAPYQAIRSQDGYIVVGGNNDKLWKLLCEALGDPSMAHAEEFESNEKRMANRSALVARIEKSSMAYSSSELVDRLLSFGVPAGPISSYDEVLSDNPHLEARKAIRTYYDENDGVDINYIDSPIRLSRTPARFVNRAPLLGEHNSDVLDNKDSEK